MVGDADSLPDLNVFANGLALTLQELGAADRDGDAALL